MSGATNTLTPRQEHPPKPDPNPDPVTAERLFEYLKAGKQHLVEDAFRKLWLAGRRPELGRLFYQFRKLVLDEFRAFYTDPKIWRKKKYDAYILADKILNKATDGNGRTLREHFNPECNRRPLTDEEREKFGEAWKANQSRLWRFANFLAPGLADELLSDCFFRMTHENVMAMLLPEIHPERVLAIGFAAIRFAHKRRNQKQSARRRRLSRFVVWSNRGESVSAKHHEEIERMEWVGALYLHIATLTEKRREYIISHFLEGEEHFDIAERSGCKMKSVQNGICSGMKDLRERLPPALDPGGPTMQEAKARAIQVYGQPEMSARRVAERFGVQKSTILSWNWWNTHSREPKTR